MKLKKKHVYYIIGLVLAFITFIPPLPKALQYIIALIPILFFGTDLALSCMAEVFSKSFFNRYLTAIIVSLGLILTGKITYAAITMILCSAASYYFETTLTKARHRIDDASVIVAPYAKVITEGRTKKVAAATVLPGQTLTLSTGDIIPCECTVTGGEIRVDYTNLFGNGELRVIKTGAHCFSGGIVQAGTASAVARKPAKDSLAAAVNARTIKAHAPSGTHVKIKRIAGIFEPAVYVISILLFAVLMATTKDFASSLNISSVVLVASSGFSLTASAAILTHNALLSARRRGVIFTDTASLEQCGAIQTVSLNEKVSEDVLKKIDETGAIPARGGRTKLDAVLYRDRARLESDPNPSFKLALGFFSKKAGATALDSKPVRIAGAIRTARNYRTVLRQNILCVLVGKLALIALALLLNLTPAAAVVIEFAAWMICLFNTTRENM